jgi:hypothetical protein
MVRKGDTDLCEPVTPTGKNPHLVPVFVAQLGMAYETELGDSPKISCAVEPYWKRKKHFYDIQLISTNIRLFSFMFEKKGFLMSKNILSMRPAPKIAPTMGPRI